MDAVLSFIFQSSAGGRFHYFPALFPVFYEVGLSAEVDEGREGGFCPGAVADTPSL